MISNKFFVLHISFYQDQINKTNKQTDKTLEYVQPNFQLYKLSGTLWVKKRPKTFQSVSAYRVLQKGMPWSHYNINGILMQPNHHAVLFDVNTHLGEIKANSKIFLKLYVPLTAKTNAN